MTTINPNIVAWCMQGAIEYEQDIRAVANNQSLCGNNKQGHFWGTLQGKRVYLWVGNEVLKASKASTFDKISWTTRITCIVTLAAIILMGLAFASVISFTAALAVSGAALLLIVISCLAGKYIISQWKEQGALIAQKDISEGTVPAFELLDGTNKKVISSSQFDVNNSTLMDANLPLILAIRQGKLEDPVLHPRITAFLQAEMSNGTILN